MTSPSRSAEATPAPVYVVAQLQIRDRARYERYASRFAAAFARFRAGRSLAADYSPEVLEGSWPHDRVILLRFEDEAAYQEWSSSAEVQEMARERIAATDGVVLRVHGLP